MDGQLQGDSPWGKLFSPELGPASFERYSLNTLRRKARWPIFGLLALSALLGIAPYPASSQEGRKLIRRVEPVYPDLARTNRIKGVVKLRLTVARDGSVKSAEPIGGHPVLIEAALNAVEKWKYEAATQESSVVVEFKLGME